MKMKPLNINQQGLNFARCRKAYLSLLFMLVLALHSNQKENCFNSY